LKFSWASQRLSAQLNPGCYLFTPSALKKVRDSQASSFATQAIVFSPLHRE
jgi:hypothetical protein